MEHWKSLILWHIFFKIHIFFWVGKKNIASSVCGPPEKNSPREKGLRGKIVLGTLILSLFFLILFIYLFVYHPWSLVHRNHIVGRGVRESVCIIFDQ